jgi:hypothetical protein
MRADDSLLITLCLNFSQIHDDFSLTMLFEFDSSLRVEKTPPPELIVARVE